MDEILYTDDGCRYDGMDEATVIALRTELGCSTNFVDKDTYEAFLASLKQ